MTGAGALSACAADAFGDTGIQIKPTCRDIFAAILAKAELVFVDPCQGGKDACALGRAARTGCFRHCLILQCIHPAEPPHGLLVQLDRLLPGCPARIAAIQRGQCVDQLCAICCDPGFIHVGDPCYHGFAF